MIIIHYIIIIIMLNYSGSRRPCLARNCTMRSRMLSILLAQHMDETVRERVLENLRKNNISKICDTIDATQTMLRWKQFS